MVGLRMVGLRMVGLRMVGYMGIRSGLTKSTEPSSMDRDSF